jgi:MFS family permease
MAAPRHPEGNSSQGLFMQTTSRTLTILCLASACWGFSFGLGAPLASLWMRDAGQGKTVIGLNTGIYYLAIALTAGLVPRLMRSWGRGCMVAGMLVSGVTVGWFPWGGGLFGWFLVRILNGIGGAMSLIPTETLVNRNATPEQRARHFGYYAFSMALGIGLGTIVGVPLYAEVPRGSFLVGGAAALASAITIFAWLEWPSLPPEQQNRRLALAFGRNFLSFGSAWIQGYLEGATLGLMPMYLLAIGLSGPATGWLMGGTMIGVILFQVPVAWLADRLGRTVVLLGCYGVTVGALALMYAGVNFTGLAVCLFLAGACSGALYPLGLALLGERVAAAGLPRASAWYLAINCLGSLIGPSLTGAAMDQFGNPAMFATGAAAVLLVLACWAALRLLEWIRGQETAEPLSTPTLESQQAA